MIIYLVRHGETDWNKNGKIQGQTDIPLNKEGERLARVTSEGLKDIPFEKAYTSPLIRAKRTAELILAGRGLRAREDRRIMEMNFGSGEGESIKEISRNPFHRLHYFIYHPQWYLIPPRGGETFGMLRARAADFMENELLPLEGKYEYILVTAHGGLIREILGWLNGIRRSDFWKGTPQKNCSVNIIECTNGKFKVLEAGKCYY